MTVPTIFRLFEKSVVKRKKMKDDIEQVVSLSNNDIPINCLSNSGEFDGNAIRLLDEGAIYTDYGDIRVWIEKGTLQKFYDDLSDDYVGYINLGHINLADMPLVLGTWTKADLKIVDLEDGRTGLNVTPHINYDLNIVKDLMSQDIPMSVSVEVQWHLDEANSDLMSAPVADDCFIYGFSIVGNPANVSSSNVKLKGEDMKLQDLFNKFSEDELSNEPEKEPVEDEKEEKVTENQEKEKQAVEPIENASEEDSKEEEAKEDSEEEPSDDEIAKLASIMEDMKAQIEELKDKNQKLKDRLADVDKGESEKDEKINALLDKFSSLLKEEQEPEHLSNDTTDIFGIKNLKG